MKHLQDYTEAATSAALKKAGAFFAFSAIQFAEQSNKELKYASMGSGLICPVHNMATLSDELESATKAGIAADMAENGAAKIIRRELNNHESYYTGDMEDTVGALNGYPITAEEIKEVFSWGSVEKALK